MTKRELPYKYYGLWLYPVLPSNMRLATLNDFTTELGDVMPGIHFLVKCWFSDEFEAHQTGSAERFERWKEYVKAGRIYVRA